MPQDRHVIVAFNRVDADNYARDNHLNRRKIIYLGTGGVNRASQQLNKLRGYSLLSRQIHFAPCWGVGFNALEILEGLVRELKFEQARLAGRSGPQNQPDNSKENRT